MNHIIKYKNHLIVLFLLIIARLPSFFERWWYGDENIYLAIAQALSNGDKLYVDIWDNKPPLLYFIYYVIYNIFNTNIIGYKLFNLILTFLFIILIVEVGKQLFNVKNTNLLWIIATLVGIFGYEMSILNAENVYVPLILLGLLTFSKFIHSDSKLYLLGSAFFFSLAGLCKLPALFEVLALSTVLIILYYSKLNINKILNFIFILIAPYLTVILYYLSIGKLEVFYQSILGFSSDYLAKVYPIVIGIPLIFTDNLKWRFLLLFIFLILLAISYYKSHVDKITTILLAWFSISLFSSFISDRNYPHYLIQLYQSLIIGIVLIVQTFKNKNFYQIFITAFITLTMLNSVIQNFTSMQQLSYYNMNSYFNFMKLATNNITLDQFQESADQSGYQAEKELLPIINQNTKPNDYIYLFTNNPEIYPLSKRKPALKYTAIYQLPTIDNSTLETLNKSSLLIFQKSEKIDKYTELLKNYSNIINTKNYIIFKRNKKIL